MRISNTDCNPIGGYTWASDTRWLGGAKYISRVKRMTADQLREEVRSLKSDMANLDVKQMERNIVATRTLSANKLSAIIGYLRSLL